ncbi:MULTISPECIES: aminotransferase-like domain-containing protein [Paraburkholderia]|uniref:aminotransferase-like domain-containing protein n=1 Tax=Paraburkholderia TaxID=1822464 RepID=UPI002257EF1E|nr:MULTISPECIES: PLP-dependent aminotransferase family protein [Paraburkholderia]MCX4176991.1 PLP-dependent aminotransferase family protein [Paraburkholderia madseniana]MDQ6464981.1 PLP-dependent aminotransferase family protein [Paraburkholderia madseniana]
MKYVKPSAIRELLSLGADPEIISFGGGYPDASLFPLEQLNDVYHRAITETGRDSLQYTVSNGTPRLREQIARRMNLDGIDCGADDVLVLQGGQQGLDLVSKMVVDRGDIIITESPTFLGALIAFNPYEPSYIGVEMDDDGMKMDELERVLEQNPQAKLLYTVPDFQNPSGVTMSLERRKRLIELANKYDLIVLEDSPYRELRFSGEAVPPLKSMDTEGRVIFLGSFSKILAPGLRLGWAVASSELIQQLGLLKLAADTQCSTLNMAAVSLYLDTYDVDAHIASIRTAYRAKKDLMLQTIRREFPASIRFTEPSGGMFTWLTFPEGFDAGAFMRQKAVPEGKVAYVPGAPFFPVNQRENHARVSYSTQSDAGIIKGIVTLGRLLKDAL